MEFDMRILRENFPKQAEMHVFCCKDVGLSSHQLERVLNNLEQISVMNIRWTVCSGNRRLPVCGTSRVGSINRTTPTYLSPP